MVGIDIGSNSIKVIEFSSGDGNYRLENIGEALLPNGAVTGKLISRSEVVSGALLSLLSQLGIKPKSVVIGISGEAVVSKIINVSGNFSGEDIKKLVPDIVSSSLYENIDEVNYSYIQLLRCNRGSEQVPVLITAVSKKTIEGYKNLFLPLGLKVQIIDIDSMALSNSYAVFCSAPGEKVALVNIGASVINLNLLDNGIPFMLSDIPFGGQWITLCLMEKFNITYEEAERIKRSIRGYEGYQEITSVFNEFVVRAVDKINSVLDKYEGEFSRVILSGGSSTIPTMVDMVEETTGVSVELFNPFQNIDVSDSRFDPKYIEYMAPKMAVAAGLALRDL